MTDTISSTVPTPQAVAAWKRKADKLVALEAELGAAQARLEKKLKPIREQHEPELEALKAQVKKFSSEVAQFGEDHYEVLFGEASEIRTKVAVITGRLSPPSVCVEGELTEADLVGTLKAGKATQMFVAVKESLDKAAIKKALNSGTDKAKAALAKAGLYLGRGVSIRVTSKGD